MITVDRHQGTNGKVNVTLSSTSPEKLREGDFGSRKQLTIDELTAEIQSLLEDLLDDCAVSFGDIRFIVHQGRLKETIFSFSTRPNESTAGFFRVNR